MRSLCLLLAVSISILPYSLHAETARKTSKAPPRRPASQPNVLSDELDTVPTPRKNAVLSDELEVPPPARRPSASKATAPPLSNVTAPPAAVPAPPAPGAAYAPEEIFIDPPSGRAPVKKSSRLAGWKKNSQLGLWYHHYDVTLDGRPLSQPGLISGMAQFGSDYHLDPLYLGFSSSVFLPQILFKAVGLGVYYFLCFFVTAGKCKSDASFGTGHRDAGFIGVGAHVGWNFNPIPLRIFAGPDFGFFYSGLTPSPLSTFFVKGGAGFDFSDSFGLNLELRRSAIMNSWDFGGGNRVTNPSLWMISLSAVLRDSSD